MALTTYLISQASDHLSEKQEDEFQIFEVVLQPSVAARLVPAAIRSIRGYTTVSNKTAEFIRLYDLVGQLTYNIKGYVTFRSERIPENIKLAIDVGKTQKNFLLHRIAMVVETNKDLPRQDTNIWKSYVVDHKNDVRDDNTIENLQVITGEDNILRISKETRVLAKKLGNITISIKTGGTFNSAGQQGAVTQLLKYGKEGLSSIAKNRADANKIKYGADYYSKIGKLAAAAKKAKYNKN